MKITKPELIDLINELTSTIGELILSMAELNEGTLNQQYAQRSREKILALKTKIDVEREKIAKHDAIEKRKAELEEKNRPKSSR